jgi:very-short-patch-repair endonuclease
MQTAFAAADARHHGVSKRRLEASDLSIPFRGARLAADAPSTVANLAAAYARRMPPAQFFSHSTAALLNDVPLPLGLEGDPRLHVSVFAGSPQPRVRGVIGHQVERNRTGTLVVGGIRMTDAATTWCQLGTLVGVDDLVAAGDFLLTGTAASEGRGPVATIPMLTMAVERHRGSVGSARLRAALPMLRRGPLSRRETLLRLRILRAGLPEPRLNFKVHDPRLGSYVPIVDFAYPEYRIAVEYEGDHHRTPEQFRRDIRRYERLQDIGWLVVRVSAVDVPDVDVAASPETDDASRETDAAARETDAAARETDAASRETTDRIAARLRQRGWRG